MFPSILTATKAIGIHFINILDEVFTFNLGGQKVLFFTEYLYAQS